MAWHTPQTLGQLLEEVQNLLRIVETLEQPMLADDPLKADTVFEIERTLLNARAHLGRLIINSAADREGATSAPSE